MLERIRNNYRTFIKYIINGDEIWVYEFDMLTKQQTGEWCDRKKNYQPQSKKGLLIVFMDYRGVMNHKILPEFGTVNSKLLA